MLPLVIVIVLVLNVKIAASTIASVLTRNPHLLYSVDTKKKLLQLSKIMAITQNQAKRIANRSPTILSMDIESGLKTKLGDFGNIFSCSKKEVSKLVLRAPSLLCLRSETVVTKLKQLELVLSGINLTYLDQEEVGEGIKGEEGIVSESTLAIAKRCPLLLTQDIPITVQRRSVSLRYLLMGGDSIGRKFDEEESKTFEKVLRRAPELLLLDIEKTIAPKLKSLNDLVPYFGVFDSQETYVGESTWDSLAREEVTVGSREVGARLALKEPRLLMWDVETLKSKYGFWRSRVAEGAALDGVLARWPTLLMYSYGSCARLEYFKFFSCAMCDAIEARKLITLAKKRLEYWGVEEAEIKDCGEQLLPR